MTKKIREFIARDNRTLCMDGYPIQVVRHNASSYEVIVEDVTAWRGITLETAKSAACKYADDLDVFAADEGSRA